MGRSNPRIGLDTFALKYRERCMDFVGLYLSGQTCKFATSIDSHDPGISCHVLMLISVQTNCPASIPPRANVRPKSILGGAPVQIIILVVWHHGEQWLYTALDEDSFNFSPHGPIHRGANVIDPD
jgi:hypothetical protein